MPKSSKLQVVGAKIETTQNTDATLAATDYFLAESAEIDPVPEFIVRDYKRASGSQVASAIGQFYDEVKIKVALKGGVSATTPYAPHSALLQACGLIETITSSTAYAFASSAITNFFGWGKSCTIELYQSGIKHKIVGCVASSAKLTAKAGGFLTLDATFRGIHAAPTDSSFPSATYAESRKEPIFQSAALSIQSFSAIVANVEIDFGLETQLREDVSSAYGVKGFSILGRKVEGSLDPEAESVATHDFFGKSLSLAEGALSFAMGTVGGSLFTFSLPKIQYKDVAYASRGSIQTFKVPFQANQNTGDDEFSMIIS